MKRRIANDISRRTFLEQVGKSIGLAVAASGALQAMLEEANAAGKSIMHLLPQQAATEEDYWSEIQRLFPVSRSLINLNNGGVSPSPSLVVEALQRYEWQQELAPAYMMWQEMTPQYETIRQALADEFGVSPEETAITRNASEALETILLGYPLRPGEEILTTTQDYPRMITALKQRERREGIKVRYVKIPVAPKNPEEITQAIEWGIQSNTRLLLISHMVFLNGQILPVRSICRMASAKGVEVVVDGAHTFAHLKFTRDDLDCDYYATSLHKWLSAPKGTGMLYVRKEKIKNIWPLMAADVSQDATIRKFEEIGTHSAAIKLAIGEALLFHRSIGVERKEARLRYLSRLWMNELKSLPNIRFHTSFDEKQSCGLGLFEIEGIDPIALSAELFARQKIITTTIQHEDFKGIRVTPSLANSARDIEVFCDAVSSIAKKGLSKG